MKLLVQGDDYGFTRAVTYGILDAIEHGILTCTGLFVNMPSSKFAADQIQYHEKTCFGIDFNITSGHCVADPALIPHLVDENGEFIRSTVKYADPLFETEEGKAQLWPKEEVEIELEAQYQKFIELVGKEPEYVHTHSIGRTVPTYYVTVSEIGKKHGVPMGSEMREHFHFADLHKKTWTSFGNKAPKKEFNAERQLNKDTLGQTIAYRDDLLAYEYGALDGHPGYIDADLIANSTVSLERCKDLQMMMSDNMKQWIKDNGVELISYRDLKALL
ncbi:MAG: ChbG/HpnK family deacetylase [Lachnospiraceae bacterium]|nr:ChbG/HpnK family deacetylase [Lachnospiraceae bacterium]